MLPLFPWQSPHLFTPAYVPSAAVFDVAGTTRGVKVYLNEQRVPINTFKEYVQMMLKNQQTFTGEALPVV